jgi:hypothetical protein
MSPPLRRLSKDLNRLSWSPESHKLGRRPQRLPGEPDHEPGPVLPNRHHPRDPEQGPEQGRRPTLAPEPSAPPDLKAPVLARSAGRFVESGPVLLDFSGWFWPALAVPGEADPAHERSLGGRDSVVLQAGQGRGAAGATSVRAFRKARGAPRARPRSRSTSRTRASLYAAIVRDSVRAGAFLTARPRPLASGPAG